MADPPLIAYAPLKRIIKQEMPDEQEGSSIEEQNWTLQLLGDSEMADPCPLIAYPPVHQDIKPETSDEHHEEVKNIEEENWTLQLLEDSVVMADLVPIIAYPPVQNKNIKLEIPDEPQEETNNVEEENLMALRLPRDSVVMVVPPPLIAYPPVQRAVKQEILDEPPEVNNYEEENWKLQVTKDSSVSSTGNTGTIIDLPIPNGSLPSEDSGQSNERLRASSNQSGFYRQTTMNALEERETQQDTQMARALDSDEEGSDFEKEIERSEHSSLEDFDESDNSLSADSTDEEDFNPGLKAGPSKEPTSQFQKASHLKKTEDSSNITAPFKCSKCELSYKKESSLIFHLKNECETGPRFSCTQCDRKFKRKFHLQRHVINVHEIGKKRRDGLKEGQVLSFKCPKCDSSFKRKRTLTQHLNHECGVVFNCSECKKNFASKGSLRVHLLNVHKVASRQLDTFGAGFKVRQVQPYKCDQCDRTYRQKGSLTQHMKLGCGVDPSFLCPQCDVRFKWKSDLKKHLMEIHKVERSQLATFGLGPLNRQSNEFKCDLCGKYYKNKQHLKRHLVEECGK